MYTVNLDKKHDLKNSLLDSVKSFLCLTPCSIDKKCSALNATESISINPDFKAFRHQDLIAFIQETNTRKWIVVASLHGQEYTGLISISLLLPDDELWNIARQLINHLKK